MQVPAELLSPTGMQAPIHPQFQSLSIDDENSTDAKKNLNFNTKLDSRTVGSLPASPIFNGQSKPEYHLPTNQTTVQSFSTIPVHSQQLIHSQQQQVQQSSGLPNQQYDKINTNIPSFIPLVHNTLLTNAEADSELSACFDQILNSVVKIFCTSTQPHFSQPWQMRRQSSSTSSGFVIGDRWIMSNAHGCTDATNIRIRKHGESQRWAARIVHMAHDCDLVILTVDDDGFWTSDLKPLQLGDVPKLQDAVTVVGYPQGGDNVSVTKGIVSRVIVGCYSHSGESLLSIQIDAAINSGNSGGPAMQGNKVIGVAFEAMTEAQSIGYIIPTPVIRHLLDDIEINGEFTSFPRIPIQWNRCENESLRSALKMSEDQHGIVITSIEPLNDAFEKLKKDDVITAIEGHGIADDGTILFRKGERVSFRYIETSKFVNDLINLSIIRDGKPIEVTLKLKARQSLVPLHLHDKLPSYFVWAGLVFTPLSRSYLFAEFGKDWYKKGSIDLVSAAYYGVLDKPGREIVILSQILVDDVTNGYGSLYHNTAVVSINGIQVHNLKHLVELIENFKENEFVRIELEREKVLILAVKDAKQASPSILQQNQISQDRSVDLRLNL